MIFEYFVFPLPNTRYILSSLLDMGFKEENISQAFKYWLVDFYFRSERFYSSQYRRHTEILHTNFERMYDADFLEYDKKIFLENSGLDEHKISMNHRIYELAEQVNDIAPEFRIKRRGLLHIREVLINTLGEIDSNLAIPIHILDELWFNSLISNQKQISDGLRKLDYSEYLKTWHWKKVRAAMLLLNNSSCEHRECATLGESWFGDEDYLHVHHITYKNLGNERFNELSLLCKTHHHLVHAEIKANEKVASNK